ncbi:hypothetical protein G4228_018936 [Cervus hanglu yarkandensis]|nr:hypothetical protein G4228_018936 [Cervus hanglu yarkandensis]
MEEEQQWGTSRLPQNKKKLVEHTKQRYVKPTAPYQTDRKAKASSSRAIDQKRFKCECCYCQRYMGNTSGISTERKATSHSSSWDELIQELNNLMLNSSTIQPPHLQEQVQEKEKSPKQRQQKNKRMFQRLLKEWKD